MYVLYMNPVQWSIFVSSAECTCSKTIAGLLRNIPSARLEALQATHDQYNTRYNLH